MYKLGLAAIVATAVCASAPAMAAQYTFATFTFEQDDTPDQLDLIGDSATVGGAAFSSGNVTRITRSVGFNSTAGDANSGFTPKPGFDASLSLGRQGFDQQGLTQSDSTSCLFACAINMPNGNRGSSTRHGLEVSWSGGRALNNEAGDDFVIYESASTSTSDEGFMVRLGAAGGGFSDWYFQTFDAFENYSDSAVVGATATGFDISDFGFSAADKVTLIQIANLTAADTLGMGGKVLFDSSGAAHGFGSGALDPDPLYVGALSSVSDMNPVPLPASLPLLAGAFGLLGYLGRRRQRAA